MMKYFRDYFSQLLPIFVQQLIVHLLNNIKNIKLINCIHKKITRVLLLS